MYSVHKTTLFLKDCLGLNPIDRYCYEITGDLQARAAGYGSYTDYLNQGGMTSQQWQAKSEASDPTAIIKRAIEMQQEANKPAVASLEAGIPEIQKTYQTARTQTEGQRKPLEDRYANLISEIKGQSAQMVNRQTVSTANELGRRGIVGGGMYDQSFADSLNPINENSARLIKDTGISQEQSIQGINKLLADLTGQETSATRDVRNAIAQLQSGAASTGIQQGNQQYQFNTNQAMQQQQMEEEARQRSIQNALAQSQQNFAQQQYNQTTLPTSILNQQTLQKALSKVTGGVTGSSGGGYYGNSTTSGNSNSGWEIVSNSPSSPTPPKFTNIIDYNNWLTKVNKK